MLTAFGMARPGAAIGRVGVPHYAAIPASQRAYITELLPDILEGTIHPGRVHGATVTTAMSHIAIVEKIDGNGVDWLENVGDEQYLSNQ